DGTLDALVSDHMPVAGDAKYLPFGEAEPGATGLELLLSLALKWGREQGLELGPTLARITSDPARVLGDARGSLTGSAGGARAGGGGGCSRPLRGGPGRGLVGAARNAAEPGQAHAVRVRIHRHRDARARACDAGRGHAGLRVRGRAALSGHRTMRSLRALWR